MLALDRLVFELEYDCTSTEGNPIRLHTVGLVLSVSRKREPGSEYGSRGHTKVRDHFVHSIFNFRQQLNIELEIENSLAVACNFNIQFY